MNIDFKNFGSSIKSSNNNNKPDDSGIRNLLAESKTKLILSDLKHGQSGYVQFNFRDFKIERIVLKNPYNKDDKPSLRGYRLFLNLNAKMFLDKTENYSIGVRKYKSKNNVVPHFYIEDKDTIDRMFIEIDKVVEKMNLNQIDTIKDKIVQLADIIEENSIDSEKGIKDNVKNYTIPHLTGVGQPQSEEEKELTRFKFVDPSEDEDTEGLLTSLYDFSSIKLEYDIDMTKDEAMIEIDKFLISQNLVGNQAKDIKKYFNFNIYVEKDYTKINSGGILYGPPGTGKTYTVKNSIIKIFEKVFKFNVLLVNMAEKLGNGDSMYVGSMLRATNSIFQPAMKLVQNTKKPCLIFIDEGDKLVGTGGAIDNKEAIVAMKNYINPSIYPGIVVCIATNLPNTKIDTGIGERRFAMLLFDYPDLKKATNIWKGKSDLIFTNPNTNNFSDSEYQILGSIVANNVGIDAIDTFTKNLELQDEVDFDEFKYDFFNSTLGRVEHIAAVKLDEMGGGYRQVNQNEINIMVEKTKEQKERLLDAYRGISLVEKNKSGLSKVMSIINNNNQDFYNLYLNMYNEFVKILIGYVNDNESFNFKNDSVVESAILIHSQITTLIEDFKYVRRRFSQNHSRDFGENLLVQLNFLDGVISLIILNTENKKYLKKVPLLIGKKGELIGSTKQKEFIVIAHELPVPADLFGISPANNAGNSQSPDDLKLVLTELFKNNLVNLTKLNINTLYDRTSFNGYLLNLNFLVSELETVYNKLSNPEIDTSDSILKLSNIFKYLRMCRVSASLLTEWVNIKNLNINDDLDDKRKLFIFKTVKILVEQTQKYY